MVGDRRQFSGWLVGQQLDISSTLNHKFRT